MAPDRPLIPGTRDYRRANAALFLAGFVTFATLYAFQPLLPLLAAEFGVSPAAGSLPLSLATLALAVALPVSGSLSDALGRRSLVVSCVLGASVLSVATAWVSTWPALLTLRLVQGAVLAGVPAVAMAYLADEVEPRALGAAMGLYIAGNSLGGMTGRLAAGWLADAHPWRVAVAAVGVAGLALGLAATWLLPPSRNFRRRPFHPGPLTASLVGHLADPGLRRLYLVAFCAMGGFITFYNYLAFRLLEPPFSLGPGRASWVYATYLLGAAASGTLGALSQRLGRGRVLLAGLGLAGVGALLSAAPSLIAVAGGAALFTLGFFGAHAVASGWVGALATEARAQAASLYLFAYYLGSSVCGTSGGWFWSRWGWLGVLAAVGVLGVTAAVATMRFGAEARGEAAGKAAA